jgi:FdhD protein
VVEPVCQVPVREVACIASRGDALINGKRVIPDETAVAFTYDGTTHAVMMATPADLEDFALGFSLTERIVSAAADIEQLDVIDGDLGIELRMWLAEPSADALATRRRQLAGPTGCGLCGIESLAEAMRPPSRVGNGQSFTAHDIMQAQQSLRHAQVNHARTHAMHAAALWHPSSGLVALREDVGRHNALDKLAGALAAADVSAHDGMILLTSRISVEMVQKAAAIGSPLLVAVSALTALAVRTAEAAGITLLAVARADGFEIFTHPHRIAGAAALGSRNRTCTETFEQVADVA